MPRCKHCRGDHQAAAHYDVAIAEETARAYRALGREGDARIWDCVVEMLRARGVAA